MASSERASPRDGHGAADATSGKASKVTHIDDARKKRDATSADTSTGPGTSTEPGAKKAVTPASRKRRGKKGANYNHAKVAALKAAIANGTYSIDPQRIADKFIEQESP